MSEAAARAQITLSRETIHNPAEPRHFMRIKPVAGRVRILRGNRVLAASARAVRVIEAGRDVYDPVLYLPRDDVSAPLAPARRERTFCPLKGHASYFDLLDAAGAVEVEAIAWSYDEALDIASELGGRIAFYARHVTVEERPPAD